MIIRVKFMTRPGDQWGVRDKVFARIRELFERENIKFAHREVTVRIADHEAGKPLSEAEKEAAAAAARSVVEQREAGATAEVPGTHPLMIDLGREDGDGIRTARDP